MNVKLQEADRTAITTRYLHDPHAFSVDVEAARHNVSTRTIHNTINRAGIKMPRGRKPLIRPTPRAPRMMHPPSLPNLPRSPRPPKPQTPHYKISLDITVTIRRAEKNVT